MNQDMFVKSDISPGVRETRKKLAPFFKDAVNQRKKEVKVLGDVLVVDGLHYEWSERANNIVPKPRPARRGANFKPNRIGQTGHEHGNAIPPNLQGPR